MTQSIATPSSAALPPLDTAPIAAAAPGNADRIAHHIVLADLAQRLPQAAHDDGSWPKTCKAPWLHRMIAQALAQSMTPDTESGPQEDVTTDQVAALENMARQLPPTNANDPDWPEACRTPWLRWMAAQAIAEPMAMDKRGRWIGYIEGVAAARGWLDSAGTTAQTGNEPMVLDKLAHWTGYIQGVSTARGWLDVGVERDRTRPVFHAAAARAGRPKPPTIGTPGHTHG